MEYLTGKKEREALRYMDLAAKLALNSTCKRSLCGSVIVKDDEVIGKGFNSPPKNLESQIRCMNNKKSYSSKVTDKTCCVHAEQRAMIDALKKNADKIDGSRLYFIRLDEKDNPTKAGKPYCTICSKMALDVGIKEFILWHKEGICSYDSREYNNLSFGFI